MYVVLISRESAMRVGVTGLSTL